MVDQPNQSIPSPGRFRPPLWTLVLAGALGLYLAFGLAWISLPGPYQDEMLFLSGVFSDHPVVSYSGGMWLFKHKVPLMLMPYVGATKGLLWRLVFFFWPPSIYSARVPAVLLAAVTLLLFYFWARRYYSAAIAAATVLLAAADPGFIFTSRLDWGPVVLQRLLWVTGLLLGSCWLESGGEGAPQAAVAGASEPAARPAHSPGARSLAWLAAAGFCFGLGLWDKTAFAWFLIALGITLVALFPRQVLQHCRRRTAAVLLLALLAGAFPLIRYNLTKSFTPTSASIQLTKELAWKLRSLQTTLDGRATEPFVGGNGFDGRKAAAPSDGAEKLVAALSYLAPPQGTVLPWALVVAFLAAFFARGVRRQIFFPLLMTGLMWAQALPLEGGGGPHHYVLAYPFPQLAIAAVAAWGWSRLRGALRLAPLVLVAALILTMAGWSARELRLLRATGGAGNWSDASYDIAAWLQEHPARTVVCMDWGFSHPLLLLSQGRLDERDMSMTIGNPRPDEFAGRVQRLVPLLFHPNTLYLFHSPRYQNFPGVREVFDEAVRQTGLRERVAVTFKQRNGEDVALLSEVVPASDGAQEASRAAVTVRVTPGTAPPGGEYTIECPQLAGKTVDLYYLYSPESSGIAERFAQLDSHGRAIVRVPRMIPGGKVEIVALRESGTSAWRPASATITVK